MQESLASRAIASRRARTSRRKLQAPLSLLEHRQRSGGPSRSSSRPSNERPQLRLRQKLAPQMHRKLQEVPPSSHLKRGEARLAEQHSQQRRCRQLSQPVTQAGRPSTRLLAGSQPLQHSLPARLLGILPLPSQRSWPMAQSLLPSTAGVAGSRRQLQSRSPQKLQSSRQARSARADITLLLPQRKLRQPPSSTTHLLQGRQASARAAAVCKLQSSQLRSLQSRQELRLARVSAAGWPTINCSRMQLSNSCQ